MNSFLRSCRFALLFLGIFSTNHLYAQMVGADVFLQGDYVEVGVAANGAFGSGGNAPAGYHPRPGTGATELGFVSDPDKDGWTVGTPGFCGDYFVPGDPQEGWDIQVGAVWAQAWRGIGFGPTVMTGGLTGANTGYTTSATQTVATWQGKLGDLSIKQVTTLKKNKLYFVMKVTLKNTGTTNIDNIYYDRTLDPDNVSTMGGLPGVVTSSGSTTVNIIEYKLPNLKSRTLVSGTGLLTVEKDKPGGGKDTVPYPVYLGLGTKDCRAKPYILGAGLKPGNTDSLSRLYANLQTQGAGVTHLYDSGQTNTTDAGIGLIYKIDRLKPGDSTSLFYAYVLSTADLDSAFKDMSPVWSYDGREYQSGDTVKICRSKDAADERKNLDITGGEDYEWRWVPRPNLENLTGVDNSILLTNTAVTYYALPSEAIGCLDSMNLTIMPYVNPDKPTTSGPVYYCQHDISAPLTASKVSAGQFRWYTEAVGGTGVASLSPVTNVVGSRIYYVSVLNGICESDRTPIEVIVRALPVLTYVDKHDPIGCTSTDGTITIRTDAPNKPYKLYYDKNGVAAATVTFTSDMSGYYTITGLTSGTYTAFIIENEFGCKSNPYYGPVELGKPTEPGPELSNNGPVCPGDLAVLKSAVTPDPLTYSWTGPDGFTSTDANPSFIAKETSAGVYTLQARKDGCRLMPTTTTLVISAVPRQQKLDPRTLCEQTDLEVAISSESLTSYQWTGPGFSSSAADLEVKSIQLSQAGRYILSAITDAGCRNDDTLQVKVDKNITIQVWGDTSVCVNDSATLYITTDGPSVVWSPATGMNNAQSLHPRVQVPGTTVYTATAATGNTCAAKTGTVTVTAVPAPLLVGYDTVVRMNIPYTLNPVYGQDVVKWTWLPSDSLSCGDCPNPVFNSNKDQTYVIAVSNSLGCISRDTVTVRVFCDGASVTMPNAFTPNNDGHNDLYYVRGHGFVVKRFVIYNRLGQEVFSRENFTPNDKQYGWDGTFNGTKITDAAGFVYLLEVQCYNSGNESMVMKGTVLLIR